MTCSPSSPFRCRPLADSEKLPIQKHRNTETSKSPENEDIPVVGKKSKKPKKKEKKHREKERERKKEKEQRVRPTLGAPVLLEGAGPCPPPSVEPGPLRVRPRGPGLLGYPIGSPWALSGPSCCFG